MTKVVKVTTLTRKKPREAQKDKMSIEEDEDEGIMMYLKVTKEWKDRS